MEIWATPTHPPLRTYTNSSLASCILVQLSDLCNLGLAVHVQYGNCWYHQYMLKACPLRRGVYRGASHLPNSLIYQKVPQIAVCEQIKSEKLGILCIFGQRNSLKSRKGSSFVRFAPSEAKKKKKKNPEFLQKCPHSENQGEIHFWKICTHLRQKSLVWAWLKPVKCIGLGSKGGLGSWVPSIFWGGLEYPLGPPKKSYILKNLDLKRAWNYAYISLIKYKIFLGKGALPPCNPPFIFIDKF